MKQIEIEKQFKDGLNECITRIANLGDALELSKLDLKEIPNLSEYVRNNLLELAKTKFLFLVVQRDILKYYHWKEFSYVGGYVVDFKEEDTDG